jgi:predicted secreted protein
MKSGGLLAALSGSGVLPVDDLQAKATAAAYSNRSLDCFFAALGSPVVASDAIRIIAPDHAESGLSVPIAVNSRLAQTTKIHILVEGNRYPWLATFTTAAGTLPQVATRGRMAGDSTIHAIIEAGSMHYTASTLTRVSQGAHEMDVLAGAGTPLAVAGRATGALPIRTRNAGGITEVLVCAAQPMHDIVFTMGGRMVLQSEWGPFASPWPLLQFYLQTGARAKALDMAWTDDLGVRQRQCVQVG